MPGTEHKMRRARVVIAASLALAAVSTAGAQRNPPRQGRGVEAKPAQVTVNPGPFTGDPSLLDLRLDASRRNDGRHRPHHGGPTIVYLPADGLYYPPVVYDAYGRPLQPLYDPAYGAYPGTSRPGVVGGGYPLQQGEPSTEGSYPAGAGAFGAPMPYPAPAPFPSYTPDFSGAPYVVTTGGDMLVDLPNGERGRFPACAAQAAAKDPAGRARTVFYPAGIDGVILHEGSRGRVQGVSSATATSCYTTDSHGRMVLGS